MSFSNSNNISIILYLDRICREGICHFYIPNLSLRTPYVKCGNVANKQRQNTYRRITIEARMMTGHKGD